MKGPKRKEDGMPNIEIHGLPKQEAEDLREKIFGLLQGTPYVNEMVVTIYQTVVKDKNGDDQPFIRLVNSPLHLTQGEKMEREILERLETLDIDIEHLKLEKFIPKKK